VWRSPGGTRSPNPGSPEMPYVIAAYLVVLVSLAAYAAWLHAARKA
jgi:hypothetical protein